MLTTRRSFAAWMCGLCTAARADPAKPLPTSLRLGYLEGNPAQAFIDPQCGRVRGVVPDIHEALQGRTSPETALVAYPSPAAIVEAVRSHQIDLGFVAPNGERVGVSYSQPYMRVRQTFLVAADAAFVSVNDVKEAHSVVGANSGDSAAYFLKSRLPQLRLIESTDLTLNEAIGWLKDKKVAAFAANRQRLSTAARSDAGVRLLADDLFSVSQAVAVATDRPELLASINAFLEDMRASGLLERFIVRSGVAGIAVAP